MKENNDPLAPSEPSDAAASNVEVTPVLVELKGDLHLTHAVSDRCVLGRSPECAVWLMDRLMSRRHAEIRLGGAGGYRITDLGSKWGTFLNRVSIQSETLRPGDELFLGSTLLRFEERKSTDQQIRRHQNRVRCHLPVRVTVEGAVVETVATDISLGGLRLDWGRSPGLGTPMQFEITVPGREEPLRLAGHANHKSDKAGLGVRFYYTSDQDEGNLAEAYAQLYLASTNSSDG